FKDEYLDFPENSTAYYSMNVTKPPFNDARVRRAFALAVDRVALSNYRKVTQPLYAIVPSGVFPDYDKARDKVAAELKAQRGGISPYSEFDAEQARKLLADAGFPVQKTGSGYSCPTFPTDTVSAMFNTNENNK